MFFMEANNSIRALVCSIVSLVAELLVFSIAYMNVHLPYYYVRRDLIALMSVFVIISIVLLGFALIFSISALQNMKKRGDKNKSMAIAGLVISIVVLLSYLVYLTVLGVSLHFALGQ
jgi:hypothetical protein